jgi:N-acyl-D-aspartate/D-glutamate deacylase
MLHRRSHLRNRYSVHLLLPALITSGLFAWAHSAIAQAPIVNLDVNTFDRVINNGHVIDPASGLSDIRHIGIKDGRITAVSQSPLYAANSIDAKGLIVSPGFIDIHSHSPTPLGQQLSVLDGVTTQLDLEAGAYPVAAHGHLLEQNSLQHFGSSVGHFAIRWNVVEGVDQPYIFYGRRAAPMGGRAWTEPATAEQIEAMRHALEDGLASGGIGIGLLLDYMTEAITAEELTMVFETAAKWHRPVTVHVRRGLPGDMRGLLEIIEVAERTGASTLICHITHSAMGSVGEWLAAIDAANSRGAQITTETLSWLAGGTSISADVFLRRDWRQIFDIDYTDVQWVANGEWLTEASFLRYQREQPQGMVNHHYVKEEWLIEALQWPAMMISSDALPAMDLRVKTNPNIAGTFSQFIARYVRELKVLTLEDAIARITWLPARWLESSAPSFLRKGRIQPNADADLVIFDPELIAPKARYGEPYETSIGISYVLVSGHIVALDGHIVDAGTPGVQITAGVASSAPTPQ